MNKSDLEHFLAFAKSKNMMHLPVTHVHSLYLQDLQDKFEDYVANQELMRQLEL